MEKICKNCKWARETSPKEYLKSIHWAEDSRDEYRYCYYYPPKTSPLSYSDSPSIKYYSQDYPVVFETNFCSKFEAKDEVSDISKIPNQFFTYENIQKEDDSLHSDCQCKQNKKFNYLEENKLKYYKNLRLCKFNNFDKKLNLFAKLQRFQI